MSETKVETLKRLYHENNLSQDDVFIMERSGKKIPIITRSGINKIEAAQKITVTFKVEFLDPATSTCIIRAKGMKGMKEVESFGSATPKNNTNAHFVEMAEKRARGRVVLMLAGLYAEGHFSEDENFDDENRGLD